MNPRLSKASLSNAALAVLIGFGISDPGRAGVAPELVDVNLLQNAGFDSGIVSWNVSPPNQAFSAMYVQVGYPGGELASGLANHIQGGTSYLRADVNYDVVVTQIVDLPSGASGMNLEIGGFLGGVDEGAGDARLVFRVLSLGDAELEKFELAPVSAVDRNYESVMLLRSQIVALHPLAARVEARIELTNNAQIFYPHPACADSIFVKLVNTPVLPAPHPLNKELIVNSEFAQTWSAYSPLNPKGTQTWEGSGFSRAELVEYGKTIDSYGAFPPSAQVSKVIDGGGHLLWQSGEDGSALHQRIDLRGDKAIAGFSDIGLRVSGFLGGFSGSIGDAENLPKINVRFQKLQSDHDQTYLQVGQSSVVEIGPVRKGERNFENVMLPRRSDDITIPPDTEFVDIEIEFVYVGVGIFGGGRNRAFADNVSAKLVSTAAAPLVKIEKNLIRNPSFESGKSIGSSPLVLDQLNGWEGLSSAPTYGTARQEYGVGFSSNVGVQQPAVDAGGHYVTGPAKLGELESFPQGTFSIHQLVDLRSLDFAIEEGYISTKVSAFLGVGQASSSSALVSITLLNKNKLSPQLPQELGPVTSSDLISVNSLVYREKEFDLPNWVRYLDVEIQVSRGEGNKIGGVVDGISLELHSSIDLDDLAPPVCDSNKLKKVRKFTKSLLNEWRKFVSAEPMDQVQAQTTLNEAIQLKSAALIVDLTNVELQVAEDGGTCTSMGTPAAEQIKLEALDYVQIVVDKSMVGADLSVASDRELRKQLFKLARIYTHKCLTAHVNHIVHPDIDKLNAVLLKAGKKYKNGVDIAFLKAQSAGLFPSDLGRDQIVFDMKQGALELAELIH